MHLGRKILCIALFAITVTGSARRIHGGMIEDVGLGLGQFGFDFLGNRNLLSGGIDFLATNRFVGNELDFGASDLSLVGPISLGVSTGGRALSELEITLRTSETPADAAERLQYLYNVDVGNQITQVEGSILLDATMKLNGFGFYDLALEYSSRQTIDEEGRFANDSLTSDFDLGPVHVRGNILADVLALITDPFFENAGLVNVFSSFSGQEQLRQIVHANAQSATEGLAAADSGPEDTVTPSDAVVLRGIARSVNDRLYPAELFRGTATAYEVTVVPEPVVLLLMLLGLPLVLSRRHR